MKRWLIIVLLLIAESGTMLKAQLFYEVRFNDATGRSNDALMLCTDEKNCTLYLRRHKGGEKDLRVEELKYVSERNTTNRDAKKDDSSNHDYKVMVCEKDNTPIFIWLRDKDETPNEQQIPYVTFNENESVDKWIRAEAFSEVALLHLTPDYLSQYLDTQSTLFQQIAHANSQKIRERDEEFATLGDGTAIYRVVSKAVKQAQNGMKKANIDL